MKILSIEEYSEHHIARILWISNNRVHYCLQLYAETSANVNRKRSGRPRVISIAEVRHLIESSKRNRRKLVPELTAVLNSTHQHPISVMILERRLLGFKVYVSVKKPLLKMKFKKTAMGTTA